MGKLANDIADGLGYWGEKERALVARVAQLEAEFEELVTFTRAKLAEWDEAQEEIRVLREANEQLTDQIVRGVPEAPLDGSDLPDEYDLSVGYEQDSEVCTGAIAGDEFGGELRLVHDEFTFCPVHDVKR